MEEIWKDVEGYEGIYQVSDMGRVKSLNKTTIRRGYSYNLKEKIMKPQLSGIGYYQVSLWKDKKFKLYKVHRLVASNFLIKPDGLDYVNHKDEVKTNNTLNNLEWCTHKYNDNYGTRTERLIAPQRMPVLGFNPTTGEEISFISLREADRQGYNRKCISRVISGKQSMYRNFKWIFTKEDA